MKKNIIVTDANGNVIGSTYPKRAEGLVRNGRAEYVSDCEIRLISAHSPTAEIKTEEQQMSKIIEFDPRKFAFDKSCRLNSGQRAFMTTTLGNAEVWEIGDHDKHRTQIISKMKLQKYTDYTFRFAMTGGHNEDGTEVSLVNIYPENRWGERLTYALDKSRYEPVVSKRDKTGLLRVFELPFNTGDSEDWNITIVQELAPARLMAPLNYTAYEGMSNMTYQQWIAENGRKRGIFGRDTGRDNSFGFNFTDPFAGGSTFRKLLDMAKQGFDVDRIIDKAKQGFDIDSVIEQVKQGIDPDGNMFSGNTAKPDYVDNGEDTPKGFTTGRNNQNFTYSGEEISESELADKLVVVGSCCNITFRDMTVNAASDRSFMMIGSAAASSNITFENVKLTAYALSMIIAKVGNNCNVTFSKVTVTDDGLAMMIDADSGCSGVILTLNEVTLPKQALDLIYKKFIDGCNITANNISATFTAPKEDTFREAPKTAANDKDNTKHKSSAASSDKSGLNFTSMLRSTFENAAEGLNSFGEMMRKAESDINNVIDDIVNDKKDPPKNDDDDEDHTD